MTDCDRLNALLSRFEMTVTPAPDGDGNLAILGCPKTGEPKRAVFAPRADARCCEGERLLASAHASWGGAANPLVSALPDKICFEIAECSEMSLLLKLFKSELEGQHCGVKPILNEDPGRAWRNEDLAAEAGLSLSRFSETFLQTVGETPQSYLRRWRMTLAHQDIAKGDRVQAVARRYGYSSPEALSRAFARQFEVNPLALRRETVPA